MTTDQLAEDYIEDLFAEPSVFSGRGRAYELLQFYFDGADKEGLRRLLRSEDQDVRGVGVFIANELGSDACELVSDLAPLAIDSDPSVRWDVLESILLCAHGRQAEYFWVLPRALEDSEKSIVTLAMRLISKCSVDQLRASIDRISGSESDSQGHRLGIDALLAGNESELIKLFDEDNTLLRRYAAVGASRKGEMGRSLLEQGLEAEDDCIREFCEEDLANLRSR